MNHRKSPIEINIFVHNHVITHGTCSRLVVALFEFLAFHRNQIPFVFETFKHMVNRMQSAIESEDLLSWNDYQFQRQKTLATETLESYSSTSKAILKVFENHDIKEVAVLFGATIFAPKEIFKIRLPDIDRKHSPDNHVGHLQTAIKRVLMTLSTSEELFDVFSKELAPTNSFLMLKKTISSYASMNEIDAFEAKPQYTQPQNVHSVTINIISQTDSIMQLNCCQDMFIFTDFHHLSVKKEDENKISQTTVISTINEKDHCNKTEELEDIWYEPKIRVKGFRDVVVKGKNIWQH